jgi:hypothetical protein
MQEKPSLLADRFDDLRVAMAGVRYTDAAGEIE